MTLRAIPRKTRLRLNAQGKTLLPPIEPTKRVEVQYRKALLAYVDRMAKEVKKGVVPLLDKYESEYVVDSFTDRIAAAINVIAGRMKALAGVFGLKAAETMVDTENDKVEEKWVNIGYMPATLDLQPTLDAAVAENVSLIKSIPDEYFKDLTQIIMSNVNEGTQSVDIKKAIQHLTGVTRSRARLIARDQTGKVTAAINQRRQTEAGVVEYVWQDSRDSRVRPTHRKNHGKVFQWNKPPKATGHPGHDVNCRCNARAVIPKRILKL